jgi:hypothetical protein
VAAEKVAATPPAPVPAPVAVATPTPATPATPAAAAPARTRQYWPRDLTAPMPPAAGKLLQVLHAAGAVDAQHGITKGRAMANGCTHYGPTECRTAGLIDWTRGTGGSGTAGTRYLYLTPAGVAWGVANPTPIVLPVAPVAAPVTPAVTPPAAPPAPVAPVTASK